MKRVLLVCLIAWISVASMNGQKNVYLSINHMFNGEQAQYGEMIDAENGSYILEWVSYYLSDFILISSDGTEYPISDSYALVKMDENGYYTIGKSNAPDVSGMKFHIGVPETVNHDDPASWPEDHPLNYQSPSMHWGWAGGYIFFVFNGMYDAEHSLTPDEIFDMEAIGDAMFRPYEMDLSIGVEIFENEIYISLNADYYKLTDGISMPYGNHGDDPVLGKMMDNIADQQIFTEAQVSSDNLFSGHSAEIICFPNPNEGNFQLEINRDGFSAFSILQIFDIMGKQVQSMTLDENTGLINISVEKSGVYYLVLSQNDKILNRLKVIVF